MGVVFYQLDRNKTYEIYGEVKKSVDLVLLFSSICYIALIVIVGVQFEEFVSHAGATIAIIGMFLGVSFFFVVGLINFVRCRKQINHNKAIMEGCELTEGKIESVQIKVRPISRISGSRAISYNNLYIVKMNFSFFDRSLKLREEFMQFRTKEKADFKAGDNIMVAFNDIGSVVMRRFEIAFQRDVKHI